MKLSIRDLIVATSLKKQKDFSGHDRTATVGASEVGQCLRKTWFSKNSVAKDPEYVEGRGALDRGDLIENHYWVPGIRQSLPEGLQFLYAGDEQRTLVQGFVSATPDGMLVGVARDCLAHLGVPDIGHDELIVEAKSIDPRVELSEAKSEHEFQTQMQMGLIRECTNHKPEWALITYVNASFLDDIKEYPVQFDEDVYAAGKARALEVMTKETAGEVAAEGKIAGGKECRYCPWEKQCAGETFGRVPREERKLDAEDKERLRALVFTERMADAQKTEAATRHAGLQEAIKNFLIDRGTYGAKGDGWSVSYRTTKTGGTTLRVSTKS